ncbi:DUF1542 domain-containing protein, partial [Streptococcus pseudopneumoniae]
GETAIAGVHTNGDLEALKKAAKADLAKKLADKLAAIDNTPNATKEEKDAAKDRAKQAADKAIQAIDAASDQAGVDKAQADGIAAVAAVNPVAKDKAKEAVAAKLKEKEAEIDANANLSDAEKAAAKEQAKAAADKAIQAIDAASDQAGVDKAQADGIAAIAAVNPVAKDKAKAAALPNTGSRSDSTTAALGLLSIFGAVGLLFSKKKKDDEEA